MDHILIVIFSRGVLQGHNENSLACHPGNPVVFPQPGWVALPSPPYLTACQSTPRASGHLQNRTYRQTPNINRTLVGNRIVDQSDVVGASPVGAAPTTSSFNKSVILDLTPGFNILHKEKCMTRRGKFKFSDSVSYIRDFTVVNTT